MKNKNLGAYFVDFIIYFFQENPNFLYQKPLENYFILSEFERKHLIQPNIHENKIT
jgi:hypothetical protein